MVRADELLELPEVGVVQKDTVLGGRRDEQAGGAAADKVRGQRVAIPAVPATLSTARAARVVGVGGGTPVKLSK